MAGEHYAVTLEAHESQLNSCFEKSHKLSGKHATESSFSGLVGKLWKLASLLEHAFA